jgi:hypothetical protein
MATLLSLAFEVTPPYADARSPPVQSHQPCGRLEMGQKGPEVNCRGGVWLAEPRRSAGTNEIGPDGDLFVIEPKRTVATGSIRNRDLISVNVRSFRREA